MLRLKGIVIRLFGLVARTAGLLLAVTVGVPIAVLFLGVVLVNLPVEFAGAWQAFAAQIRATYSYETTAGTIAHSSAPGSYWREIHPSYTYTAGGEELTGRRYRYYSEDMVDLPIGRALRWHRHPYALEVVSRYPEGKQVTVYYDPQNPRDAILRPGLEGRDVVWLHWQLLILLVLGACVSAAVAWWREWTRESKTPQRRVIQTQHVIRLSKTYPFAVPAACLTTAFFGFFSQVPTWIWDEHAYLPVWFALVPWVLTLSVPTAFYVWVRHKRQSERQDYIIRLADSSLRLPVERDYLRLPERYERTGETVIPIEHVRSVFVRVITMPWGEQPRKTRYIVTLSHAAERDELRDEILATCDTREEADRLADWWYEALTTEAGAKVDRGEDRDERYRST